MLNAWQHLVIRIGFVLILVMSFLPPWRAHETINHEANDLNSGHAFLLTPPGEGRLRDGTEMRLRSYPNINLPCLATQWAIVTAVTGLAVSFMRGRQSDNSNRQA